jgi:CDGSH-type Zn-finger protein
MIKGLTMTDANKFGIKIIKNGPYIVNGNVPLSTQQVISDSDGTPLEWRTGREYPAQDSCALCRSGRSKNKPFCDRTHSQVAFDGTETADNTPYLKKARRIERPELTLTDC